MRNVSNCRHHILDNTAATSITLGVAVEGRPAWHIGEGVLEIIGDSVPGGQPLQKRQWNDVVYHGGQIRGYALERYTYVTWVDNVDDRMCYLADKSQCEGWAQVQVPGPSIVWVRYNEEEISDCSSYGGPTCGPHEIPAQ